MDTLEDKTPQSCASLPTKLQPHIPSSRKVYIVLLWILLTHGLYNYTIFNLGGVLDQTDIPIYIIGITQVIVLLLFPLAGIIGEVYWTRYKVMITGTVIMLGPLIASPFAYAGLMTLGDTPKRGTLGGLLTGIALVPFQIGIALFESNVIQFGTDQLLFASSDQLSSFVHWSFWCMYIVPFIVVMGSAPLKLTPLITAPMVQLLLLIFAVILICLPCTRRTLELHHDRVKKKNPVSLVVGVFKYAKSHKYPENRSAFTYNDEESYNHINFAKERYGGPYSTEEVEDVKTFGQILILFLSLFGFLLTDNTGILIQQYRSFGSLTDHTYSDFWPFLMYFMPKFAVIVVGVPLYRLILCPFFSRYLPNMTKRMGLGLVCSFAALATESVLSFFVNKTFEELGYLNVCGENITTPVGSIDNETATDIMLPSESILIIPQVFNGLSLLLTFLTALEFVLAQSPRSMQGLLIGVWYALQSFNVLLMTLLFTLNGGCSYISYAVRAGLAIVSFVTYVLTARWYKGRKRQESSNIQQNIIIEEYTARMLRHEAEELNSKDPYVLGYYDLSDFSIQSRQ
ncbi:PREDICTED: solute carrier family 15 member 4-like [Amphimedon queenslandica]|uniref:Major facilitator superfamily (MFS) profile domain-containing protein n=1 Tax=Amphimedon queenslandica TaxID=400682 RepID=A0A1X7VQD8_AMPQE|nr:PREDICTED: solute carrier family 15 member 4-like [Amphimedon queenslandica]|eukprot:XP_011408290.1 PREDICTED: solute carrier family 15 member 4-like [Amphimedon queenslandica]